MIYHKAAKLQRKASLASIDDAEAWRNMQNQTTLITDIYSSKCPLPQVNLLTSTDMPPLSTFFPTVHRHLQHWLPTFPPTEHLQMQPEPQKQEWGRQPERPLVRTSAQQHWNRQLEKPLARYAPQTAILEGALGYCYFATDLVKAANSCLQWSLL